ncbi:hypothetical protein ACE0DR_22235 [Azotobacter sp. CWF10]
MTAGDERRQAALPITRLMSRLRRELSSTPPQFMRPEQGRQLAKEVAISGRLPDAKSHQLYPIPTPVAERRV